MYLVSLTPKRVYDDQMVLQKESELEGERKRVKRPRKTERKRAKDHLTLEVKQKREPILFAKAKIERITFSTNQPLFISLCKEILYSTNSINLCLPSMVVCFM